MTRKDFTDVKEGDIVFLAKRGVYLEAKKLKNVDDLFIGYVTISLINGFKEEQIPISAVALEGHFSVRDVYKDKLNALSRAVAVKEIVLAPNTSKGSNE